MKYLMVASFMFLSLYSCRNPKEDISSEQISLKNKIDSIDHINDSLVNVVNNNPDMDIEQNVKIQLYSRKLQKEKEEYLRALDSIEKELK